MRFLVGRERAAVAARRWAIGCLVGLACWLAAGQSQAATYAFRSDTYAWETATNPVTWEGLCTNYPEDDDQATITFTDGFTFTLAGTAYSSVRVLTNGMLQFGSDTGMLRDFGSTPLPELSAPGNRSGCPSSPPQRTLMLLWSDLTAYVPDAVTWEQKGTAPHRYVVISWNDVYWLGNDDIGVSVQVILFENGSFKYQFLQNNPAGNYATIGVQVSESDYTQFGYNTHIIGGTAIRWTLASAPPLTITATGQTCGAPNTVYATFSEPLDPATAQTAANYALSGTTVTGASLSADRRTVVLTLADEVATARTLTVNHVMSYTATLIAGGTTATVNPTPMYPGLLGTYYGQNGKLGAAFAFTGTTATRIDRQVNFNWSHELPGLPGIGDNGFSVRWTGFVKPSTSGEHGFATGADDGVRLTVNGNLLVDRWTNQSYRTDLGTTRPTLAAGSYVPITLEYFENTYAAVAELRWQQPGQSLATTSVVPAANLYNCVAPPPEVAAYSVTPQSANGSTCAASVVTIRAVDATGSTVTGFTGSVTLGTSTGIGTWGLGSNPAPGGAFTDGNGAGNAAYTFAAADNGAARLTLSHGLAQDVSATVTDGMRSASGSAIRFSDNAFVFAEDLSSRVAGTHVAVAGRPHDMTLTLIRKDPVTGQCGTATSYTGSRPLKLWRTDAGGSHTPPVVASTGLVVPAAQPAASNLTLNFTSGVAGFDLGTSDVGRYALSVLDDSRTFASVDITGSAGTLTVRPFVLLVEPTFGATANPGGAAATDSVFAPAGASFSATVGAYRWSSAMLSNGADAANTGTPAATASRAAMSAGGLAPGFAAAVTLAPLAGSQTPAGGVLGSLNNGSLAAAGFSGGSATAGTLQYTEVGSFQLATTGVVSDYLGSGLALDAVVVNGTGVQQARIGRFVPARLSLSDAVLTHRSLAACAAPSAFTYLDEVFRLGFTLTAQNALGATTANYTGAFARLDLANAAALRLAGVSGSTAFATAGSPARLSLGSSAGTWHNGVASGITLSAAALRATSPDGPFSAAFGIAPLDSDGVALSGLDMAATPGGTVDRRTVATVALRFGRLQLSSAAGAADRSLALPVVAQHWDGSTFAVNTLDHCTTVGVAALNFGNLRQTLTTADTAAQGPVTLAAGRGRLTLNAPQAGRRGTYDVAVSLGAGTTPATCVQPWSAGSGDAATAGANLAHLRGAWCGTGFANDPSARATFGLQRTQEFLVYRRENY